MRSVKLYVFCCLIFLTITLLMTAWGIFPFSFGKVHVVDQSQFLSGLSSLLEQRSIENSITRTKDTVEELISTDANLSSTTLVYEDRQEVTLLPPVREIPVQRIEQGIDEKHPNALENASQIAAAYVNARQSSEEKNLVNDPRIYSAQESGIVGQDLEQMIQQSSFCYGRRIYVYDLLPQFNTGVLQRCNNSMVNWLNFCPHIAHNGFGQSLMARDWYATDAYMLEVIYHAKMQTYSCRTLNSSQADAFFIPYYSGLDALRYIYGADKPMKAQQGLELLHWLEKNARETWRRWGGKDHFIVMGRTAWDFSNPLDNKQGWGTSFLEMQAMANVTSFVLEKRIWRSNEQAVPYPTSFHPSSSIHLQEWMDKVESSERKFLFAITGAPRPQMKSSIRGTLFSQCDASSACTIINCSKIKCAHNPEPIAESLLQSKFCLQPAGDTATRRSTFDSIITGCIPVFFHNDSAYTQYNWHLPSDPDEYSVFIPEDEIRNGILLEDVLKGYSGEKIKLLQLNVRKLIPRILYTGMFGSDAASDGDGVVEDAFEMSVKGMLNKVATLKQQSSR
ncbi:hypothetical protein O6H91_01G111900 [Diphasiastrum complanatum]|nr:hypothetical protein O6H91_01G111900 [Diphasiastrum complanatum]